MSPSKPATWVVVIALLAFAGCKPDPTRPATAPAFMPTGINGNWIGFQGSGELRGVAGELGGALRLRWTYEMDAEDRATIEGCAAIVGDTVYVGGSNGEIHAINLTDGTKRWVYSSIMPPPPPDSAPATTRSATTSAATAPTTMSGGRDLGGSFTTSPLVVGDRVFAGDLNGIFHAVSAKDGKRLWTLDAKSPIHSSANLIPREKNSIEPERIVVGSDDKTVFCLDAETGRILWQAFTEDRINSCPMVTRAGAAGPGSPAGVWISGCDAVLRNFDARTGDELRKTALPTLTGGSAPLSLDHSAIIIGTDQGHVLCKNFSDLSTRWTYDTIEDQQMVYSSPAVSEHLAVVGARDGNVYAFDLAKGTVAWKFKTRGDVDASPVIAGAHVYIGSRDKKFYALELATGKEVWSFTAERGIVAPAAVGRGVLIVSDTKGNVYCFEPKSGPGGPNGRSDKE